MEEQSIVPVDIRYQLEQYHDMVTESAMIAKSLTITSVDDARAALEMACDAINLKERIEDTKKEITEPSKRFQNEVNGIAKKFVEKLDEVKEAVVEKVDEWKTQNQDVVLETARVSTVDLTRFDFEIEDLSQIPQQYLTINEDMVKLAMKQGIRIIPGLSIRKTIKTSIKRKVA